MIERSSATEDSFNIEEIKKNKLCISIREEDLANLDINKIEKNLKENIDYKKLNTYEDHMEDVVNKMIL